MTRTISFTTQCRSARKQLRSSLPWAKLTEAQRSRTFRDFCACRVPHLRRSSIAAKVGAISEAKRELCLDSCAYLLVYSAISLLGCKIIFGKSGGLQVPMANEKKKEDYSFSFIVLTFLASVVVSSIAKQHLRNNDAAVGISICTILLIFTAKIRWDLKRKWWFWIALCIGAALQLPLVLLLPWDAPHLTGAGALVFAIPGFLMALGCIFLAEKILSKKSPAQNSDFHPSQSEK